MDRDLSAKASTAAQKALWSETIRKFRGTFATGDCFLCGEKAIRSHTISNSNYLQLIAENGHVMSWKMEWWATETSDFLNLERVGVNEASTFPGFCSVHDGELFRPLDVEVFKSTREQLFLQAYRTDAREVHCKRRQVEMIPEAELVARLGGIPNPETYVSTPNADFQRFLAELGLRDTESHHNRLEQLRKIKDYGRLEHCVITLKGDHPVIACAGAFYPESLPDGTELQNFKDVEANLETIHFSILPNQTGAYVVFSFLDTEGVSPRALVNAILNHARPADLIAWMAFAYIENTFLRPSWWSGLRDEEKQAIRLAFEHNNNWSSEESHTMAALPDAFSIGHDVENHFWM